jgi:hypothetical protein
MDKIQKHNSFNTNTPSSESYKNYSQRVFIVVVPLSTQAGNFWIHPCVCVCVCVCV